MQNHHNSIADRLAELTENPPESVEYKIRVRGKGALKIKMAETILCELYGMSQQEAASHLVRSGAENQINRIRQAWQALEDSE